MRPRGSSIYGTCAWSDKPGEEGSRPSAALEERHSLGTCQLKVTVKTLSQAVEAIRPYLKTRKDVERFSSEKVNSYKNDTLKGTVARLRLDWEFSDAAVANQDTIIDLMVDQLTTDLEDLIENGDVDNGSDPLLKSIDGSKKRGKQPVDIDIFEAVLFSEHFEKKRVTHFTTYLLMHVEWEDE